MAKNQPERVYDLRPRDKAPAKAKVEAPAKAPAKVRKVKAPAKVKAEPTAEPTAKPKAEPKAKPKAEPKAKPKAKARPARPAPEDPGLATLQDPIQGAKRAAPQVPGLGSLAAPVRPWVTPDRKRDAPEVQVIDLEDEDAPGVQVMDLEDEDAPGVQVINLVSSSSSSGDRGSRQVRVAPPKPVRKVIGVKSRLTAKEAALRPGLRGCGKTRGASPRPAKQVIAIGDAASDIAGAARERARQIERAILGAPAGGRGATGAGRGSGRRGLQVHSIEPAPRRFEGMLDQKVADSKDKLSAAVAKYYKNEMMRRDSRNVPGQFGQPSLVEEVMREDALDQLSGRQGPGWRPVSKLGGGGQGGVTLWEMNRPDGSVSRNAPEFESECFNSQRKTWRSNAPGSRTYNSEGNLTRRLNEAGCENVLKVLEWALLERPTLRFRIAYEVAEYGALSKLITWYSRHRLIFPVHFVWHIWHSLANTLTYQALGHNDSAEPVPDWEEIIHGDITPPNILLCAPDPHAPSTPHAHYPACKLADYGMAYTIPLDRPDVRRFKSTYHYATRGYTAPEVEGVKKYDSDDYDDDDSAGDEARKRYNQYGPHSDVYSVAGIVRTMPVTKRVIRGLRDPYAGPLDRLMQACTRFNGRTRPRPYDLFVETGRQLEAGREAFEAGVRAAEEGRTDYGIYPGMVLFGKEEQRRFETDMAYRDAYKKMNLASENQGPPRPTVPEPPRPTAAGDDTGDFEGEENEEEDDEHYDDGPSYRGKKRNREDTPED